MTDDAFLILSSARRAVEENVRDAVGQRLVQNILAPSEDLLRRLSAIEEELDQSTTEIRSVLETTIEERQRIACGWDSL